MRRHLIIAAFLSLISSSALAANSTVPAMTAGGAISDTDLMYCVQSAGTTDRKCTPLQLSTYIFGKVSSGLTCTGLGVCTVATNANLTGDVTSSGNATTLTNAPVIAKVLTGFTSGAGTVTAADSILSAIQKVYGNDALKLPLAGGTMSGNIAMGGNAITGGGAITGTAITGTSFVGLPTATTSVLGVVKPDGSTITITAGVISAPGGGSGTVTSVAAGCGTSTGGSAITTTGTVSAAITRRANATTSDTIVAADCGNIVSESNAASIAVAIAQAGTTGFANGTYFSVCNIGVGTASITPTTSTIGGASTYALPGGTAAAPKCVGIQSDGTNYNVVPDWFAVGALATITPGTGVATAAAANLSAAGGLTSTIFHGTLTIPSTAIGSGACGTAITVAATNVATTDVVTAGFAADPTATTGFLPTAMLTIVPYPTSGNINAKVCNLTGSSITPTSTTINVSVVR